jgi:hypothetical protein
MLWTCTTVHRAHGRLRSSVRHADILLRHLLGTWPSSRGVMQVIALLLCVTEGLLWSCCELMIQLCDVCLSLCFVCGALRCVSCRLMGVTAGGSGQSNAVDLYNSASGTWSTAQLSVARSLVAATSVGNVAIFAGGVTGNCSLVLCCAGGCVGVAVSG